MAGMDDARKAYRAASQRAERSRTELIAAREEVRRLRRRAEAMARVARGRRGDGAAAELRELEARLREAEKRVKEAEAGRAGSRETLVEAQDRFAPFTDPPRAVGRMPDDVPFALFPLRLETRYQTRTVNGAPARFLCVRVFPDDVLVDTFQPEIAQVELDNVTLYWTHVWRAGGSREGRRAAWAALVRSHGAGRARWLTQRIAPLDPDDEPVAAPGDHILVVRTVSLVPDPEKGPIARFWERVWSSRGAERDEAFADLASDLSDARAAQVEQQLAPVNLRDPAVKPGPSVKGVVAFLSLPDPATLPLSQQAWTRPARAWLLPERLVLMGFRNGAEVLREVGEPVPAELQVGPDPMATGDQQLNADEADLQVPEALRWTVDLEDARARGMAFCVNLTERGVVPELDLLLVLGVRSASDAAEGAAELSELIRHHQSSRKGFSLLPQGRATNNTDTSSAGYSWWEDPDESFRHFFETDASDDPSQWERRKDGAWLAGMLGLDPEVLRASPAYNGTDQAEARAMNIALWPATLGYFMEQMMEPVFSEATVRATRAFFNRFVIGRGTVPLVRIGRQPIGILPATAWSRMGWWSQPDYGRTAAAQGLPGQDFLSALHTLSERAATLWRGLSAQVARVGTPGADPHQTLLDIVGLHPGSAELYQRYAQSFSQHYNTLGFATSPASFNVTTAARRYVQAGLQALGDLGWSGAPDGELPGILEKIFLGTPSLLKGDLVQAEVTETAPLASTRADGLSYIAWLQTTARISHDALRRQEGFDGAPPRALLYLLLHHALDLGFVDTALALRRDVLQLPEATFKAERKEPAFMDVAAAAGSRSRWQSLYLPEPAITGDPGKRLGDAIPSLPASRRPFLEEQLSALDVLKAAGTAALERALLEHLDCLSYRLDAWRAGMQAAQLSYLRQETANGFGRGGLLIGAYGWLENLRPKEQEPEPVELDPELAAIFGDPDGAPLLRDPSSAGHIHAPSLDHAVTAAILRSGHLANASPGAPDLLAVELTSERVRLALRVIDGIRNGQSLGALLGYRLERALHEVPGLFLDRVIYALRAVFPLIGNRNRQTQVAAPITQVEARNVIDGEAFLDHVERTGAMTYPYGVSGLPGLGELAGPGMPTVAEIGAVLDRCVAELRSVADAVADLGVAEGVYQVVRGNYDRAAAALDALSKGTHPPVMEVCSTPRGGCTMTHRVALHLQGGLAPTDAGSGRPRALGEPALALWLAGQMPDPATVFARVGWRHATTLAGSLTPSMADLGLAPVDLFYLLDAGGEKALAGFDELLIDFAEREAVPRHDAVFELEYRPAGVTGLTLFELAPLVRSLRGFVLGSRALTPGDLSLPSEGGKAEGTAMIVRADKPQAVLAEMQTTLPAIETFIGTLEASIAAGIDPELARDAARDHLDQWLVDYAAMARPVAAFGLPAGGLTAGLEGRRPRLRMMREMLDTAVARWQRKQQEYDAVMAELGALPGTATDAERTALLIQAGRTVSTSLIAPLPPLLTDLEDSVGALRAGFDAALISLTALRDGAAQTGATLTALGAFLPTYEAMDYTVLDLAPFRDSVLALARDLLQRAIALRDDISVRIAAATSSLARAAAATGNPAQAAALEAGHALLGESFLMLPEFTLSSDRLAEWENVWARRAELLAHLTSGPQATRFPVEDWLHGVARVRERARHLEMAILLGEALGADRSPTLDALQFPHRADDAWLGLRFPETASGGGPFRLVEDRLLYSPHFGPSAEIDPTRPDATYSGLLLDEWVEVVPTDEVTTGLAFHFDRPGSEAPQAILLVTPAVHHGTWRWEDLVDALRETLDSARLRAVEPAQIDQTTLGPLIPAVLSAVTMFPITAMLNFALNNSLDSALAEAEP
ncbi:MAG: hypothetical protein ACREAA_14360 [Candidatus Polarisedimenticolia bacterium]